MDKVSDCRITLYAIKSTRSNAKSTCNSWAIYSGHHNLKSQFTQDMDYADMKDWLQIQPYTMYKLVVYKDNINLHNCNAKTFYSIESVLYVAYTFGELLNASNIKGVE